MADASLTLLAFSTSETAPLLDCWLRWATSLMAIDRNITYRLHVTRLKHKPHLRTGFGSEAWRRALRSKLHAIRSYVEQARSVDRVSPIIVTDLDVVPLRPYSLLLPLMGSHDVMWMREPRTSRAGYFNCGFYVLRPSKPVLEFLKAWATNVSASDLWNDQRLANRMLTRWTNPTWRGLRWGMFPDSAVAGFEPADTVKPGVTVAYHATGAPSISTKLVRINHAIRSGGRIDHLPMCTPDDKVSDWLAD